MSDKFKLETKAEEKFEKLREEFQRIIDEAPVDPAHLAAIEENLEKLAASEPEAIESDKNKPVTVDLSKKGFFSKIRNLLRF